MPLAPKSLKIILEKSHKNPSYKTNDTKSQVTVLACVNAAGAGECIPPFVIFDRK